jgi:hypothetical protein
MTAPIRLYMSMSLDGFITGSGAPRALLQAGQFDTTPEMAGQRGSAGEVVSLSA